MNVDYKLCFFTLYYSLVCIWYILEYYGSNYLEELLNRLRFVLAMEFFFIQFYIFKSADVYCVLSYNHQL
jgi:hypothetical protein